MLVKVPPTPCWFVPWDPFLHLKQAINDNSKGLMKIAGERIWTELKMIFSYSSAPHLLRYMADTGVTQACGLPEKPNLPEMEKVFANAILSRNPNAATCVATSFNSTDEVCRTDSILRR